MNRNGNGRRTFTTIDNIAVTIAHDQRANDLIPVVADGGHEGVILDRSYNGMPWYELHVGGVKVHSGRSQSTMAGHFGWLVSKRQAGNPTAA